MPLRSAFLIFSLLAASHVLAGSTLNRPSGEAAGKIGLETWRKVESGEVRELLVEFRAASGVDAEQSLPRRERFRLLKSRGLAGLSADAVAVRRDFGHLPMNVLRFRDAGSLLRLLQQPDVKAVYEIRRAEPLGASLDLIGQPQAAQLLGQTGVGAVVAVLDTGVNYTGSAFGSCTAPGVPAATCKVVAAVDVGTDDNSRDDNGHGTNVAAIALSAAAGAKIAAVDVCDPAWGCYSVALIAGIDWAISQRDQGTHNIVAINISLGSGSFSAPCAGSSSYGLETAVQEARVAGILTVVASGNNSYANSLNWPACVPGVVSVGAVYETTAATCTPGLKDTVACFSNVSSYLSLLTPASATSYAAPLAAGATAVLAAAYPAETPTERSNRMLVSGKPVTDNRVSPVGLGYVIPRLDMVAALRYPDTASPVNDDFAAASLLSGDSSDALGWNDFAGQENGEPQHAGPGGASVWWRWTAAVSGTATLDSHGSNFDTLLAVYAGDAVDALTGIAANDDDGGAGGVSGLSFHADAGATYQVALDGKSGATGNLYLNRNFSADPATTANLSVSVEALPDPVALGATLTYSIVVKNSGPATAADVTLSQTLPAGTDFLSADAGCNYSAGTVVCALNSLAAGAQLSRAVHVAANTAGVLSSQAQVATSSADGNSLDNVATASSSVSEADEAAGDVPLPAWALALLGMGLLGAMRRSG